MSDYTRSQSTGFEAYPDYAKVPSDFDFFLSPTTDIIAPQPEDFESELDSLAGLENSFEFLKFNPNVIPIQRTETFYNAPSSFTASSESAYDAASTRSESFYNYPRSPYTASTFSFSDFDMELSQVHPRGGSDYTSSVTGLADLDDATDPTSFGTLPPTPPRSPVVNGKVYDRPYSNTPCFSDYSTSNTPVAPDQFFTASLEYTTGINHPTVSPLTVSPRPLGPVLAPVDEHKQDPRKKHKCPKCPRAFARAYNLKTHMGTHDPNRLKPHICHHRNCGRSFSRKHDLGRHLTSIHRDEVVQMKKPIGVAKGGRTWCDSCGKGTIGRGVGCDCHDIK
ncbi:hypothetical protein AMATHDRAFT_148159 [Amanita thiersii Skay4041]|uniref:C2H2-type domain-containing protein n=1 Tax=Amanita thiersii Skay4041 TaxID=703135 RepID=A0A2A9NEZ6_9AGAR|nr:hypothetical protein AMATHDRAFT_148159 [Amanita thiersii Skay4041]